MLVSRHENELSGTTDVATREECEDRRRDKTSDGEKVAGWFAEDFTLAELRTLRVGERAGNIRPDNARYNGLYQTPTLAEIVQLLRIKDRFPSVYPIESFDTLLDRDLVDAVVIATPTASHYELTMKALEHDLHVFVEKPLAKTSAECRKLVQKAGERNRTAVLRVEV